MDWNFEYSYTELPNIYYSYVKPQNIENPKLLLFNSSLAKDLNLKISDNNKEICDFLLGKNNKILIIFLKLMLDINLVILLF